VVTGIENARLSAAWLTFNLVGREMTKVDEGVHIG
jgi:hypothetical protein